MVPFSGLSESWFKRTISYILVTGVVISFLLESVGIIAFYVSYGHLKILENKAMFLHGKNFFNFVTTLLQGGYGQEKPIFLMSLGIAILILTPYFRVVMSVLYFAWGKNFKYVLITLFVLVLLTISLVI